MAGELLEYLEKIISGKQSPTDYLVVRVSIVHVKRLASILWSEKVLGHHVCIASTRRQSAELMERILRIMQEYGVSMTLERKRSK